MSRSILYANNPSAYVHRILDRVAGKPEFGDSWANKSVKLADVPPEMRKLVSTLVGGKDTFSTGELRTKLFDADSALTREDKGIFGHAGILGVIGGGNNILSEREQARAERKNPNVKPVLDYIYETRGEK
jgi:hypothetical protein